MVLMKKLNRELKVAEDRVEELIGKGYTVIEQPEPIIEQPEPPKQNKKYDK